LFGQSLAKGCGGLSQAFERHVIAPRSTAPGMGDDQGKEKPMRAILNRVAVIAAAAVIAASAALPAAAATQHKRRAPAPQPIAEAAVPATAYPDEPGVVRLQPQACFTDEGYGRFASCDQNGF